MKTKSRRNVLISLMIGLLLLPAAARCEKQKVKVVVEKASIRLKPNLESEVIASPTVDTIFDVEKKIGEWFEIKFYSKIGVLITGYVHQMFVELVRERAVPETKAPQKPAGRKAVPTAKEAVTQKRQKANLKVSAMACSVKGYDYIFGFPYRNRTFIKSDAVEKESLLGLDLGLGYFVTRNLELEGCLSFLARNVAGYYAIGVPSPYGLNDPAYDIFTDHPSIKELILSFGLNIHPLLRSRFKPYFGVGGGYIVSKWELMEDILFRETTDDVARTHSVEIYDVDFKKANVSKLAFSWKMGLNVTMSRKMTLFSELRFLSAKKKAPHPISSPSAPAEVVEIDLGGGSLLLGIKIFF